MSNIKVIEENVVTALNGIKWEIRKKTPTYILVRSVGMKSSMRIKNADWNKLVEEKHKI